MDVLPSGNIFRELQDIHDTGYFSPQSSIEELYQQVSGFIVFLNFIFIIYCLTVTVEVLVTRGMWMNSKKNYSTRLNVRHFPINKHWEACLIKRIFLERKILWFFLLLTENQYARLILKYRTLSHLQIERISNNDIVGMTLLLTVH